MPKPPRIPKTLQRKLMDLDDHLYLLAGIRNMLAVGEAAYLKLLAAELRVLVCHSSGTEGFLWRVTEELDVSDGVDVHLPVNVDRNHSLARELDFAFFPLSRSGEGDPRRPPAHCSLRGIIKKSEAVFVSGRGYTHEKLIKDVAQQMGSAHEDDIVDPHLVELSEMIFNNQQLLTEVLVSVADFVLEVGDRAIEVSSQNLGYCRKSRPRFVAEGPTTSEPHPEEQHFEGGGTTLSPEGTVMFVVNHPHPDWRTNSHGYSFGTIRKGSLSVTSQKHPDGTMGLTIAGLTKRTLIVRRAIPAFDQPGVMVGITWDASEIVVYLNGQEVDTISYIAEG